MNRRLALLLIIVFMVSVFASTSFAVSGSSDEWSKWYNSLSKEQQNLVNYDPTGKFQPPNLSLKDRQDLVNYANQSPIPDKMFPYAVALYDKNLNMHVFHCKEHKPDPNLSKINRNLPTNYQDRKSREEEDRLISEFDKKDYPRFYCVEQYFPDPNTIVVYGTDGVMNHFYAITEEKLQEYLSEEDISSIRDKVYIDPVKRKRDSTGTVKSYWSYYNPLPRGTHLPVGIYQVSGGVIRIEPHFIIGEGRLTTFTDPIGENGPNDPNRQGDCATKGEYDNAPYHQQIKVRNLDNDMYDYLRKNDNGKLPNAVLDVYKWEGVFLGEIWNYNFSFEHGRYYYAF